MNKLHSVKYSEEYWRIVAGPWLRSFIQGIYVRYLTIKMAEAEGVVTGTIIPISDPNKVTPYDFTTFKDWIESNDEYNDIDKGNKNNSGLIDENTYPLIFKDKIKKDDFLFNWNDFLTIVGSMALSECGDRTQINSFFMAAIFDFKGVMIGSCLALLCTVTLGVYFKKICKFLSETWWHVFPFPLVSFLPPLLVPLSFFLSLLPPYLL